MSKKYYCDIYIYTTPLNAQIYQGKVGSVRREANSAEDAAKLRIDEQVTAAVSADAPVILEVIDVSDICETGDLNTSLQNLRQLESFIHKRLKNEGMWVPAKNRSEWFFDPKKESLDNIVKATHRALNVFKYGSDAISDFPAYEYQTKIVDWAIDLFKIKDDLLINAIMRSGKCFISYEISKKLKAKNILVLTAKTKVNDSWAELLPDGEKSHVNYANWKYHDYNQYKKNHLNLDSSKTNVVFCSLQYINKHFDNPTELLKTLLNIEWDIVIFDEQHYATDTDNTERLWKSLNFKKKLELSGTPYKTILSGRYSKDSIYNFDYVEEQLIRKTVTGPQAEDFRYRADISYAMVNVPDSIKQYLGTDGFTFPKLFATDKKTFKYQVAVNEFLQFVISTFKNPPEKFLKNAGLLSRHTLWILPNDVDAIDALCTLLRAHPFFSKRTIINASGNNVTEIQEVKNLIKYNNANDGSGTIVVTCGRFLEGTSVPEWWSVHQMNNDKSAADYFQGSFRCKTPDSKNGKESVVVFDYAPERFINVVYQYCEQVSIVENKPVETILSQWLAVSEVYDYVGNQWNIIDGEEVSTRFLSNIANHMDRIGNAIDESGIDETIVDMLQDKKKEGKTTAKTELNSNNIFEGRNKLRTGQKKNLSKSEEKVLEQTVLRIRYALRQTFKLLDLAWSENLTITSIDDIINYKDISTVEQITGLFPNEWAQLKPALNITSVNRAIKQYNDFQ
jgi:superfamily II DNA or RNA helicase